MVNSTLKRVIFCGLLAVSSEFLSGCSLFQDLLQQDSLTQYGESVFRRQNLITSRIMLLSESDLSAENSQKLQQAESQMQQSCQLLNESATREMDNISSNLLFRTQVRESIENCDLSVQRVETLLNELGIKG